MTDHEVTELLKGEFTLDIPNFEKWNPPIKDKKTGEVHERQNRSYFNLSVHFFDDPKIRELSEVDVGLYLRLIGLRARFSKPLSKMSAGYVRDMHKVRGRSVQVALLKLWKLGLISLSTKEINKEIKKEIEEGVGQNSNPPETPDGSDEFEALTPRLPKGGLSSLFFQFEKEFLRKHLRDAIAYCDTKGETVGGVVPLKILQRYLRIARDNPNSTKGDFDFMAEVKQREGVQGETGAI